MSSGALELITILQVREGVQDVAGAAVKTDAFRSGFALNLNYN